MAIDDARAENTHDGAAEQCHDDKVADDAEGQRKAEAANVTHGEEVEDECRDERYHIGVKRGEDAFLDARGCRRLDRFALAYLLVETFHDENRGVGGHAYVDDDARDARQGEREPSHLGEQGKQAEVHDGHEENRRCRQQAKPLVEDEEPHHDKRDADKGREYARPQRLLTERGADRRGLLDGERDG